MNCSTAFFQPHMIGAPAQFKCLCAITEQVNNDSEVTELASLISTCFPPNILAVIHLIIRANS